MSAWQELSKEQQDAVQAFRDDITDQIIGDTEAFYKRFPELRLTWSFVADASLRALVTCTVCGTVYVQGTPGWYEHHTIMQDFAFCSRAHLEQWIKEVAAK